MISYCIFTCKYIESIHDFPIFEGSHKSSTSHQKVLYIFPVKAGVVDIEEGRGAGAGDTVGVDVEEREKDKFQEIQYLISFHLSLQMHVC